MGPDPGSLEALQWHVEARVSNDSGIRDPHLELVGFELMRVGSIGKDPKPFQQPRHDDIT